jgi:hypothetical protein
MNRRYTPRTTPPTTHISQTSYLRPLFFCWFETTTTAPVASLLAAQPMVQRMISVYSLQVALRIRKRCRYETIKESYGAWSSLLWSSGGGLNGLIEFGVPEACQKQGHLNVPAAGMTRNLKDARAVTFFIVVLLPCLFEVATTTKDGLSLSKFRWVKLRDELVSEKRPSLT